MLLLAIYSAATTHAPGTEPTHEVPQKQSFAK